MRKPVKIAGSAAGNCSLREPGPARDALEREQVVLAAIDRAQPEQRVRHDREDRDHHADEDPGVVPTPKIEPMSGTMARTGIAWRATRYGHSERSIHGPGAITTASAMPSTIEIAEARRASAASSPTALGTCRCARSPCSRRAAGSCARTSRRGCCASGGSRKLPLVEDVLEPPVVHEVPQPDEDAEHDQRADDVDRREPALRLRRHQRVLDELVGRRRDHLHRRRRLLEHRRARCVMQCAPRRAWLTSPDSSPNSGSKRRSGERGIVERHVEGGDDPARPRPTSPAPASTGTPPRRSSG